MPRRPAEPRRTALHCPTASATTAATAAIAATAATLATAPTAAMASPTVLTFDAEGRAVDFDVWSPATGGAAGAGGAARAAGGAAGAGAAARGAGAAGAAGDATGAGGAAGAGAPGAVGGATRPRPYYVPLFQQVLGSPPSTGPPPVQSQSQLQPASPLPGPSPYSGPTRGLTERRKPASRPVSPESHSASPVRTVRAGHASCPRPPGTHSMTLRPSTAPQRVPLPSPPASSLPVGPDLESDSLRAASPTVTRFLATAVTDPLFESTAASALITELVDFAAACRLDYATSLVAESASASICPPSVGEAIEGPYSSLWQAAMDAEMASRKSTGTYINELPPPGANIVSGMWIFRVKQPPGSPPAFKTRYVARGFSQRQGVDFFQTFSPTPKMTTLRVLLHVASQRDYELHSLDFSTAFLQDSLHEEIWLRRSPGFTGSFPAGTQWSLRRPVYGLREAPREWHDTLRTTLASLGFAPSTADLSLFLRTDTTLLPFYVLVYIDDLVFATTDTEALAHMKFELQKRHTCTDLGPSALRLHVVLATVNSSAYRTSGMGLVLGGRARVVLTGHADASWVDDLTTQRSSQVYTFSLGSGSVSWRSTRSSSVLSSSFEAEIYTGAMAAQELHWLTYLLTDLGEAPRSPPVLYVDNKTMLALCQEHRLEHRTKHIALRYFLARELQQRGQLRLAYVASQANTADVFTKALQPCDHQLLYVDNKAMLALCQEHRLEHRTKHIALRYFLARELQQRGQLRLAYVASQANTADVFTKALQPCDHQRFCTVLGLVPTVPHLLTS
ncbi:unnamed protein product [Closterium sp. NIES-53]